MDRQNKNTIIELLQKLENEMDKANYNNHLWKVKKWEISQMNTSFNQCLKSLNKLKKLENN